MRLRNGAWNVLIVLIVLACEKRAGDDAGRCGGCSISAIRGTTMGELEGPASFLGDPPARQDSRGRFYFAGNMAGGVQVFDSAGSYLRTIGRRGPGPGEFEIISAIAIDRADTVYVFDERYRRVTVISPDHEMVRIAKVPAVPPSSSHAFLPDGKFVIGSMLLTREHVGYPLHVLDRDFAIERSFGADSGAFLVKDQLKYARAVTAGPDGEVWSAHLLDYVLEQWGRDGKKIREIRPEVDWFPPSSPQRPWREGEPLPPPPPHIVAVDRDGDGYVWVLVRIVDRNWKSPRVVPAGGGMHRAIDEQSMDEAYDTMIEVFDEETGRRIASVRHPLAFNQFVRTRTLVHRDELEDGRFLVTSYHLQLAVPTSASQGASK